MVGKDHEALWRKELGSMDDTLQSAVTDID
jgi:hypothetical protein